MFGESFGTSPKTREPRRVKKLCLWALTVPLRSINQHRKTDMKTTRILGCRGGERVSWLVLAAYSEVVLVMIKVFFSDTQEMSGITGQSDSRNMSLKQCAVLETALLKIKVM